ncbi:MAG: protein kinase [Endozoicomonadaceae bacterium]|nr:protein kinase [Endozoicomonadaceae bacterium]
MWQTLKGISSTLAFTSVYGFSSPKPSVQKKSSNIKHLSTSTQSKLTPKTKLGMRQLTRKDIKTAVDMTIQKPLKASSSAQEYTKEELDHRNDIASMLSSVSLVETPVSPPDLRSSLKLSATDHKIQKIQIHGYFSAWAFYDNIDHHFQQGEKINSTHSKVYPAHFIKKPASESWDTRVIIKTDPRNISRKDYAEPRGTESIEILDFLQKMDHPNLVTFYALYIQKLINNQALRFIIFEYIEGPTLNKVLSTLDRNTTIKTQYLAYLLYQIFNILDFLYQHKILHQDLLQAQNILYCTKTNQFKLIDFGLAKKHIDITPQFNTKHFSDLSDIMHQCCNSYLLISEKIIAQQTYNQYYMDALLQYGANSNPSPYPYPIALYSTLFWCYSVNQEMYRKRENKPPFQDITTQTSIEEKQRYFEKIKAAIQANLPPLCNMISFDNL